MAHQQYSFQNLSFGLERVVALRTLGRRRRERGSGEGDRKAGRVYLVSPYCKTAGGNDTRRWHQENGRNVAPRPVSGQTKTPSSDDSIDDSTNALREARRKATDGTRRPCLKVTLHPTIHAPAKTIAFCAARGYSPGCGRHLRIPPLARYTNTEPPRGSLHGLERLAT
ncbi:MAG: hypothetical protein QOJ70_2954 [Acidobacteriota bacterium]|jgi:hypothetical protein|nr:hypothetical protein [Acidobacteriota bacterium]